VTSTDLPEGKTGRNRALTMSGCVITPHVVTRRWTVVRVAVDTGDVSSAAAPLSSAATSMGSAQDTAGLALNSVGSAAGDAGLAAAATELSRAMSGQLELGGYALFMLARRMDTAASDYISTDTAIAQAESHAAR
jgi:hypothetical protein